MSELGKPSAPRTRFDSVSSFRSFFVLSSSEGLLVFVKLNLGIEVNRGRNEINVGLDMCGQAVAFTRNMWLSSAVVVVDVIPRLQQSLCLGDCGIEF